MRSLESSGSKKSAEDGLERGTAVWVAVLGAIIGCVGLQFWRPFYFLCDDNLCGYYPVMLEASRRLLSGHSPFTNPYLFGGDTNWLKDPAAMCLWNPVNLLISPLALTPWRLAMVDVQASIYLVICAAAFAALLGRLKKSHGVEISDRRIVFLSLSYTFSMWMLMVTPNWLNFLANQASLPVIALGLLHPDRRRGIGIIAVGLLFGLLCGHLNSFILCLIFLAIFVGVQALQTKDVDWVARASAGAVIALLVASPLLYEALVSFGGMSRSGALPIERASQLAFPAGLFLPSCFLAFTTCALSAWGFGSYGFFFIANGPASALIYSFASWTIFLTVGTKQKWSPLAVSCAVAALVVAVFVVRPMWLSVILQQTPVLRSTRIPFREVFAFLFFAHLWLATRRTRPVALLRGAVVYVGVCFYMGSTILFPAPCFTPFPLDRYLIFSGKADAYWAQVRPLLKGGHFVPVTVPHFEHEVFPRIPWVLLGAYNYASMVEAKSRSGYVIRGMQGSVLYGVEARRLTGIFRIEDVPALKAADPTLKFLVLTSLKPIRLELRDGGKVYPLVVPQLPKLTEDMREIEE